MASNIRPNTSSPQSGEAVPPSASPLIRPPLPPASYPVQSIKCSVEIDGDQAYAMVLIEPHILKRLRTRYPNNLDDMLWDNVFKRALYDAVY